MGRDVRELHRFTRQQSAKGGGVARKQFPIICFLLYIKVIIQLTKTGKVYKGPGLGDKVWVQRFKVYCGIAGLGYMGLHFRSVYTPCYTFPRRFVCLRCDAWSRPRPADYGREFLGLPLPKGPLLPGPPPPYPRGASPQIHPIQDRQAISHVGLLRKQASLRKGRKVCGSHAISHATG